MHFLPTPENETKWQPDLLSAKLTSNGPVGVGAEGCDVRKFMGKETVTTWRVTEFVPNRKMTFKVIAGPTDERPDADDKAENREFSKADVDFVQAVEATVAEISDGRITDLSLDAENQQLVWEAEVSVGSEQRVVQIDAGSGKVLSNRADD